jgi:hypothetical protein
MKKTRILFVLGLSAVFSSMAYAGDTEPAECDDAAKPPYAVKITVDTSDHSKPPVVEPDTVCAGFHDDITFTANVDRFFVTFNRYSPFMANMNGAKGKAVGKVNVKFNEHNEGQNSYQYTVHVPGYPPADPWIRIRR